MFQQGIGPAEIVVILCCAALALGAIALIFALVVRLGRSSRRFDQSCPSARMRAMGDSPLILSEVCRGRRL